MGGGDEKSLEKLFSNLRQDIFAKLEISECNQRGIHDKCEALEVKFDDVVERTCVLEREVKTLSVAVSENSKDIAGLKKQNKVTRRFRKTSNTIAS